MGALLDQFTASGVRFDLLPGGQLRALGNLTDELRASIREHKPTLLAELAEAANDRLDGEAFEERAAIMAFDAGLSREAAEHRAFNQSTAANTAVATTPPAIEPPTDPKLDPAVEARRQRVLNLLAQHPEWRYAVVVDSDAEPGVVTVHVGIRGRATGELVIDRARYDPVEIMRCMDRAEVKE